MNPIDWREGNIPISTKFQDPYYSLEDGRAETAHVFINGNNLPARWQHMHHCMIAELGFGTGLNFLETVRQWKQCKPAEARLKFVSFERYPLKTPDLERALSRWPELAAEGKRLLELWDRIGKTRSMAAFAPDIELEIHVGDANNLLPSKEFLADAWFLDGFSPAKNHELWNEPLMKQVGDHSVAGGTFATYTAAGFVRRNLQAAGFDVRKVRGFGRKRDMLIGAKPNDIHVASGH